MKKIISLVILLIILSGCIGGPSDNQKETPGEDLNLPEEFDTNLEKLVSQSEANTTGHSGEYTSKNKYNFSFGENSIYMKVSFPNSVRELYYQKGSNKTFVRYERNQNVSLSKSTPLMFSTVYDLLKSEVNTTQMQVDLQKQNNTTYNGTYTYKDSEGEIQLRMTEDRVIKELRITESEDVESDIKLRVKKLDNVQVEEPSWVQEIRDRQIDPDEIEPVTGTVNFTQSGSTLTVELVEIQGGEKAIVVSDTGNVEFPQGNELRPGESIRVEEVKSGEPILVRGVKPDGSTWSIDLYIAR